MPEFTMPTVALLAGGLATRMRPATLKLAKSMLPVAGEPMLGHQLHLLAGQGVQRVVLCCGYLEEQLQAYAGDGSAWGLQVRYSSDGAQLLGTGGALHRALPLLGSRFAVMYGDSFLPTDLGAVWRAFLDSGRQGLMTVFRNDGLWDTSNVWFTKGRIAAYSKSQRMPSMRHIDYGLNCFVSEVFAPWPAEARFDLADVHATLLARDQLAGYEVQERFYEIGSPAGLAETDAVLRQSSFASRREA